MTGGTLEKAGNPLFSSISTDSRNIKKGDLFIPIKGEKFDGHRFIPSALKSGAAGALTSKKIKLPKGKTIIYVKDTLKVFIRSPEPIKKDSTSPS